jgi:filamentous hemagglutinin family protein
MLDDTSDRGPLPNAGSQPGSAHPERRGLSTLSIALVMANAAVPALAAQLPVPCIGTNCGAKGPTSWVSSGNATGTVTADTLRINQTTSQATLNWSSFNISADGHVLFQQPDSTSIALNRIYQQSPSNILGQIQANGQIYLVNPNGLIFGSTARVSASGILASTLKISDSTFASGLLSPGLLQKQQAALVTDGNDLNGNPLLGLDGQPLKVSVVVDQGAQLTTNAVGGRILLAGQNVQNAGLLQADDGQVILAAGTKAYLTASTDVSLRGILVEVDGGGTAWNQLSGQLTAAHGDITLVGLAVNQDGRISATTSVSANGSVHLLAGDTVKVGQTSNGFSLIPQEGGTVTVGGTSQITVNPDLTDTHTAVDEQQQLPSQVDVSGSNIYLRSGSSIIAHGGDIDVSTLRPGLGFETAENYDPNARIHVESGVTLDASGSDVTLPMSTNFVTVQLRSNELANFPLQRDGALKGQTVVVDARASGTRPDGSTWVGTPVADVSATVAAVPRNVAQRTSAGGEVVLDSTGDLTVASGAVINVSGGVVSYTGGPNTSSQLITSAGQLVNVANADPNQIYRGVAQPSSQVVHDRWGVIETAPTPYAAPYIQGYQQGQAAGSVQFAAPDMLLSPTLMGQVVRGPYQRTPSTAPSGGTLIIGSPTGQGFSTPDYQAPSVMFASSLAPFVVTDDTNLPRGLPVTLSSEYLQNGFTSTEIFSNGSVIVPRNVSLSLAAGSTFAATAQGVDILGDITGPGASLSFSSVYTSPAPGSPAVAGITIGPDVTLDVSGNWTNDVITARSSTPAGLVAKDGGSISVSEVPVGGSLIIGDDVQLRLNGGAWLSANGKLAGGKGGSLAISAAPTAMLDLGTGTAIAGYGVGTAGGGSFSLRTARIVIDSGSSWLQPLHEDATSAGAEAVQLATDLFSDDGFSKFSLTATGMRPAQGSGDVLTVASGARIDATAATVQLSAIASQPSAANVSAFGTPRLLPAYLRTPSSIALAAIPGDTNGDPRQADGLLSIGSGAEVSVDAGGAIALSAVGGIDVNGSLSAPAGSITLAIPVPATAFDIGYRPDQSIAIGNTASIDVDGERVLSPTDAHPLAGVVLGGGTVSLLANRGFLDVAAGAQISAAGGSGIIDEALPAGGGYAQRLVGSPGGTINLLGAEGVTVAGRLDLAAGPGQTGVTPGGALSLAITRQSAGITDSTLAATFPAAPRILDVFDSASAPIVAQGGTNGLALLDTAALRSSGAASVTLTADALVRAVGGTTLSVPAALTINSPEIGVFGSGAVDLTASYVALANRNPTASIGTASTGGGTLEVNADRIDLVGSMTLQSIGSATLSSSGDIQLIGYSSSGSSGTGALTAAGELTLAANRIYPTSGSQFTLQAGQSGVSGSGMLRFEQIGAAPSTLPLSAGGTLIANAGSIEQDGSIFAPFGTISLTASQTLNLGAGSLTSVSTGGTVIPYGIVQNGTTWYYGPSAQVTAVPDRQITLTAPKVRGAADSNLDVSGGGDLYAYEFIPGTGGTVDALQPANSSGLFAILPSLRGQYAPYDAQSYLGSTLQPGASVYLSGTPGLPAGVYPLLPASYALLPGAFLVSAVAGTTGLSSQSTQTLPDGTPIVAGYRTFAGTGLGDAQWSGFAIRPGSYAHDLADYADHLASTFFAASASAPQSAPPVLPADAGRLTISVQSQLDLEGSVNLGAGSGGVRGQLEITAPALEIVGSQAPIVSTYAVVITDAELERWNPSQLVLGGYQSAGGTTITPVSATIDVTADAQLAFDEAILVATQGITIEQGSRVASTSGAGGAAPSASNFSSGFELGFSTPNGSAPAVIALSDNRLLEIDTTQTGTATVNIAHGATVASRGSLLLSAPAGGEVLGSVSGQGAYWTLSSAELAFGSTATGTSGQLVVTPALLASAESASALTLASSSSLDFAGSAQIALADNAELNIVAGGLRSLEPGAQVTLAAGAISLRGSSTPLAGAAGDSSLVIAGDSLTLGGGSLALSGFGQTRLSSNGDFLVSGVSTVSVPGDVDITANRVAVTGGAQSSWNITGALNVQSASGSAGPSSTLQPGGEISMHAGSVQLGGAVVAPSGRVEIQSDSDLSLASSAVIDTSGMLVTAGGRTLASPGGSIQLTAAGAIGLAAGARLAVDSAGDAAGQIGISAGGTATIDATLTGQSATGSSGGALAISAASLPDFTTLLQTFEHGGFTESQALHVTDGDLQLPQGSVLTARVLSWSSDTGSIRIDGTIQAPSGPLASSVLLAAGNNVTIGSTAGIHADASGPNGSAGSILLATATGAVSIMPGATLSAAGSQPGTLTVRAPVTGSDIAVGELAGDTSRLGAIVVEPLFSEQIADGTQLASALADLQSTATSFLQQNEASILNRLGGGSALALRPAVQVLSQGDVTLGALDLTSWRFGSDQQPVDLVLRSAGALTVSGVVSDGFRNVSGLRPYLDLLAGPSSDITLVAGANLGAADPLATANAAADLTFSPGAIVRTGTGDIQLAAAEDIVFGNRASVYTGGIAGAPTIAPASTTTVAFSFPTDGGSVSLTAGRDVVGAPVAEGISTWEPRIGALPTNVKPLVPGQWGIAFQQFAWTVGALGGGSVEINAARDALNLAVASADTQASTSGKLTSFGGGNVTISAGRDIDSPFVYVANGTGLLEAGGSIGSARATSHGDPLGALLALEQGQFQLHARGDILFESAFNPQVMPQVGQSNQQKSYFFTYGPSSALDIESVSGSVTMELDSQRIESFFLDSPSINNLSNLLIPGQTLPASLSVRALNGDIAIGNRAYLFPSDDGQLDLFAARDIRALSPAASLLMSDAAASDVPSALAPQGAGLVLSQLDSSGASGRHAADTAPALISAGQDIVGEIAFGLPKPAVVSAGRDIVDLSYTGQNLQDGQLTQITAGRDIVYDDAGATSQIQLGGPGRLDVIAGRQVNLGLSVGVTTVGRTLDPALTSTSGADIIIAAGLAPGLDSADFVDKVIGASPDYQQALESFVATETRVQPDSFAQAAQTFLGLPTSSQLPQLLDVFFNELLLSGREANATPSAGFTRGYTAINTLFPGSGAGQANAPPTPYPGDVLLDFSRIYSISGGSIDVLAPGGLLNVGLAFPPLNVTTKAPSQLGVVAQGPGDVSIFTQGDVLVNQSRVFTLGGGNILIWSTDGNIDAGRGAKSSVSAPPPVVTVDPLTGAVTVSFAGAVAGSGIRTIQAGDEVPPGNVDLIAPSGFVNAGDAGIGSSGNLNIAAQRVIGADNIQVGGSATGVPPPTSGIAVSLSGVANAGASATAASTAVGTEESAAKEAAPLAQSTLNWLDVFVTGLGEANCQPSDTECLKHEETQSK